MTHPVQEIIQSGFTLVFGGPDFKPETFLRESTLPVQVVVNRGDQLRNGRVAEESWLEFFDIEPGTYSLDLATEALDFIRDHQTEFARLACFPGITFRTLNFFGDADSVSCEFSVTDIALLHELSLVLSVCAIAGNATTMS